MTHFSPALRVAWSRSRRRRLRPPQPEWWLWIFFFILNSFSIINQLVTGIDSLYEGLITCGLLCNIMFLWPWVLKPYDRLVPSPTQVLCWLAAVGFVFAALAAAALQSLG